MEEKKRLGRPKGSGRKTKLTPEVMDIVVQGVRLGMSFKDSARKAGICEGSFHSYMAKGREGKKPYAEFLQRVESAIQENKQYQLALMFQHAKGGFESKKTTIKKDVNGNVIEEVVTIEHTLPSLNASKWLLERRFPEEFGNRANVEVSNAEGNPFKVSLFGAILGMGDGEQEEESKQEQEQGEE